MPVEFLFDVAGIDFTKPVFDKNAVMALNPHRFEFALLDGVVHFVDGEVMEVAGFHQTRHDDFWVRGHIPGTPIFPGALMVEVAVQMASFCFWRRFPGDNFFGFGGIDKVKFRGMAKPGQRIDLLARSLVLNKRFSRFACQGIVEGRIVFEGEVVGVTMPVSNQTSAAAQS